MTSPGPLALAVMVAYCGWDPTQLVTNQTVMIDGNGTTLAFLPSLYVTNVSAVQFTDGWGTTSTRTVAPVGEPSVGDLPGADVGWSENGCLVWNGCDYPGWPAGQRNIAVTYSGGYGYSSMPADLNAALQSLTSRTLSGASSEHAGPFSVSYAAPVAAGGLLLVEQMVFDRYRIPKVA